MTPDWATLLATADLDPAGQPQLLQLAELLAGATEVDHLEVVLDLLAGADTWGLS